MKGDGKPVILRVVRSRALPGLLSVRVVEDGEERAILHDAITRAFAEGDLLSLRRQLTDEQLQEIARRHADHFMDGDDPPEAAWEMVFRALREVAGG